MKETLLKSYTPFNYTVLTTELDVEIFNDYVLVESKLTMERGENSDQALILNGKDLELLTIKLNDSEISNYTYKDGELTISDTPRSFTLYTKVKIDPYNNRSLAGFYKSGDILCTQNEAEGFRNITFYPDRPDVMSKFTITLTGDKKLYPYLLANGNLIEKKSLKNGKHSMKWEDPFRKPCYLVAMVAGDLERKSDSFITMSGREVKLEIYTDPGKGDQSLFAMESLKNSMKWDEETFGLEYDLDIYMVVAVDSFNFGAMENKGLNIFNSAYVLADAKTATDSDFEGVEGVIGHEYFHNWTGNRVTCRDWFQLTLKEGLTVFRDQEFSSDMTDRTVKRINDVNILRTYQFAEDRGPNAHPIKPSSYIEIDNFYTATVYEKGAEIIRMIHTLIGKKKFREGIDLYFERYDGQAVTTEDFISAMQDASGHNLEQFKRWYHQAGTPVVDVSSTYIDGIFTLNIKQSLPETAYGGERLPLYFPFNISLYSEDGRDITPDGKGNLIISQEEESFSFEIGKNYTSVIPSLLEDYCAPVVVNYSYSSDELITLLSSDKNKFNRFDTARRLAMASVKSIIEGGDVDPGVIEAYRGVLNDSTLEKRYLAELIYIPEVKDIASEMKVYDFISAYSARKTYIEILANNLKGELFRTFENCVSQSYEVDKKAIGERTLKNACLGILSYLGSDIEEVALKQFETADNMTDYLAAYSALQRCSDAVRERVNREFHDKWKDNFLVMNKWLAVQASRDTDSILDELEYLSNLELFDKSNPNRLRSLYGVFAGRNLKWFHAIDGSGYKFITDRILEIDKFNSHISSGLAGAFQAYAFVSEKQAEFMKRELERILTVDGITPGLYEIVSKTLKIRK